MIFFPFLEWVKSKIRLHKDLTEAGLPALNALWVVLRHLFGGAMALGVVRCEVSQGDKVTDTKVFCNKVVSGGLAHIADQMTDRNQAAMSHMAIGSGEDPPTAGDDQLGAEIVRVALESKAQGTGDDTNKVIYKAVFPAGTGTGSVTEAGIFNALAGPLMFCRSVFDVKTKGVNDTFTFFWTIIYSS